MVFTPLRYVKATTALSLIQKGELSIDHTTLDMPILQ